MPEIRVPARFDSSLAMRNDDRALRPRSERSSAIDATVDVKRDYTLHASIVRTRPRANPRGTRLGNPNQALIGSAAARPIANPVAPSASPRPSTYHNTTESPAGWINALHSANNATPAPSASNTRHAPAMRGTSAVTPMRAATASR